MIKDFAGEKWKAIKFDFEFTNVFRLEISNFGRLRSFNKISEGNIVNGSMINGYRIIRLRLYSPRSKDTQKELDYLQQQVFKLASKLKSLKSGSEGKNEIKETEELLVTMKKNLSKKFKSDLKKRSINYHLLFHRLVAEYFLEKPSANQTIVAHLDYDKLNNRTFNLKWMTPEENYEHQKGSPYVKREKENRISRGKKLTVTKVMLMKKLINQGKPMKQLVKMFKVTETQILRIKRGENWAAIEAAK